MYVALALLRITAQNHSVIKKKILELRGAGRMKYAHNSTNAKSLFCNRLQPWITYVFQALHQQEIEDRVEESQM